MVHPGLYVLDSTKKILQHNTQPAQKNVRPPVFLVSAMAITLEGVNPTLFNFFSGLLSVLGQSLLLFLLSLTYGAFINWHLSSEEKMIPASMLGQVPANFASALTKLINQHLQLSFPLLILIVLFACADFSDSIARLGVAYVPTLQKGDLNTVLTLHHEVRQEQERLFLTSPRLH
jgi:hypothetical protein